MAVSLLEYIEENYDNLLSIAYSYTGNTADAQDIVQQVALEVCKRKNELNSIEFPRAYLSISIRNATINLLRKRAHENVTEDDPAITFDTLVDKKVPFDYDFVEWVTTLERYLLKYEKPYRDAFIAYYIKQEPLTKVASELCMTERQVTKKFENMRKYLKNHCRALYSLLTLMLAW